MARNLEIFSLRILKNLELKEFLGNLNHLQDDLLKWVTLKLYNWKDLSLNFLC